MDRGLQPNQNRFASNIVPILYKRVLLPLEPGTLIDSLWKIPFLYSERYSHLDVFPSCLLNEPEAFTICCSLASKPYSTTSRALIWTLFLSDIRIKALAKKNRKDLEDENTTGRSFWRGAEGLHSSKSRPGLMDAFRPNSSPVQPAYEAQFASVSGAATVRSSAFFHKPELGTSGGNNLARFKHGLLKGVCRRRKRNDLVRWSLTESQASSETKFVRSEGESDAHA